MLKQNKINKKKNSSSQDNILSQITHLCVRLSTLELKFKRVLRATRTSSLSQMSRFFLGLEKK